MRFQIITSRKVKTSILSFDIPFTKRRWRFSFSSFDAPNTFTKGISSRCMDGRHVLFFDYDDQDLSQIVDEIKFLQKTFRLSTAFVFKLDRVDSFHVIILDKFSVTRAYEIICESNVDFAFRNSIKSIRGMEWILRCAEKGSRAKPEFVRFIHSPFKDNEVSSAHKKFLEIWYDTPKLKYKFEDNNTIIPLIDYNTGNRVEEEKGS